MSSRSVKHRDSVSHHFFKVLDWKTKQALLDNITMSVLKTEHFKEFYFVATVIAMKSPKNGMWTSWWSEQERQLPMKY